MKVTKHYFERINRQTLSKMNYIGIQPCNYVIISERECYVGQSGDVKDRIGGHLSEGNYEGHTLIVFTYENITYQQTLILENRIHEMCMGRMIGPVVNIKKPEIKKGCFDWEKEKTYQLALNIKKYLEPYAKKPLKEPQLNECYANYEWKKTYKEGKAAVYKDDKMTIICNIETNHFYKLKQQSEFKDLPERVKARHYLRGNLRGELEPYEQPRTNKEQQDQEDE